MAACLWARVGFAAGPDKRPNILLLLSDDQRFDTIAALGNTSIRTPNLDSLCRQGFTLNGAYIMGGTQPAICRPSRAMLMSGRSLFHVKDALSGQGTWPAQFGAAGYTTFISGKWHNEKESLLRSFQQGKAVFMGGMGNPYKLPLVDISANHQLENERISGDHSVRLFADAVVEFLQKQKKDKPWLCYFAPNCPHDPRLAPAQYHEYYNLHKPPIPATYLPVHPFNNGELTIRDEQLAPWPRTKEVVRQNLADYYSYINFMDDQIGRILEALKATGQFDKTIIVFSSDNGLALGSHGLFGKQNLYEHATHEPLIFVGPGIPAGGKSSAFCYLFDIFPTLGEMAGVDAPKGNEGKSMAAVIQCKASSGRSCIFTSYRSFQRAVRNERWKLIAYPQINKMQLFDLLTDPNEMHDLANDTEHANEMNSMKELLKANQEEYGDQLSLTTKKPMSAEFDFSKVKVIKKPTSIE